MDLIALKTFKTVVEEGSMLLAAKKLHTVQSNITTRIKKLEESLATQLFFRDGKNIQVTPSGRSLLGYANQILQLEQQAISNVAAVGSSAGEIKLGAMEVFASFRLFEPLKQIRAAFPEVKFNIATETSSELVNKVLTHQLDAAFVGGTLNHAELNIKEVVIEELVLVKASEATNTSQHSMIVFKQGCAYRASALNWLTESGNQNIEIMELNTLDGILGCVALGLGMTIMPLSLITHSRHYSQLQYEKLPKHIAYIPTQLITHKKAPCFPVISALADEVYKAHSKNA